MSEINVSMYDVAGRNVIKEALITSYESAVDISGLSNEVYVVKISDKNGNRL
jgi:hypothetical protein